MQLSLENFFQYQKQIFEAIREKTWKYSCSSLEEEMEIQYSQIKRIQEKTNILSTELIPLA